VKRVTAALGVIALAVFGGALILRWLIVTPTEFFTTPRIVSIRKGESFATATRRLAVAGVIRSTTAFTLYARLTRAANRLKPGDYAFGGGENLVQVLRHLVNGDFMAVTISIPEGMTLHQIADRLKQSGLACGVDFDEFARDGPIPAMLGLGPLGAEGFLFPATYRFSPFAKPDDILLAMLSRFYANLTPAMEQRMSDLRLDPRALVTIASIIEKEAKVPSERPLIASVFYNRLTLGMPLQSDPTAQYNLTGESERAFAAVHAASAFNTYSFAGLPPGPIANPGLSSIRAALYPARTDYLYFVARNDGTHVFSHSFEEHQRAIEELRRLAAASHNPVPAPVQSKIR
jgi:UPF0755 protein